MQKTLSNSQVAQAVVVVDIDGNVLSQGATNGQLPLVARQLEAGAASANTALTAGTRLVSIRARGADIRFSIGSAAQTASSASHFIAAGERLQLAVPATPNIAVIRADATDGTLELTELA